MEVVFFNNYLIINIVLQTPKTIVLSQISIDF